MFDNYVKMCLFGHDTASHLPTHVQNCSLITPAHGIDDRHKCSAKPGQKGHFEAALSRSEHGTTRSNR